MKFVDSCEVRVIAGDGGNGCVAFRREKYVPRGGPSGGDGGKGGDVVFLGEGGKTTLLDVAMSRVLRAEHGEHGRGKDQYGAAGADLVVHVPLGTQGFDAASNELLFDIEAVAKPMVVARGGRGGRGNIHFATPYDRAPRRAEPGIAGEDRTLRLELKVMADVGVLGFPNVGKSTFVSSVSRARPKVADYPFTTLVPHLGVVRLGEESSFVLADIPGLVPGASEGVGLGLRFLKHVERTRGLLHLVSVNPSPGREPLADFDAINTELSKFDAELARRPQVVAMSKGDLPEVRQVWTETRDKFAARGIELKLVSAATGEGVADVLAALWSVLRSSSRSAAAASTPSDYGEAP